MLPTLEHRCERWPLAQPFRIARGEKTHTDVIVVSLTAGGVTGRGEGVPLLRYGETPQSASAQVEAVRALVETGAGREEVLAAMPAGAARNAVDCALWDLGARALGGAMNGGPLPLTTAMTVSLSTPGVMAEAAAKLAAVRLLKVKVDGSDPAGQLRAVRAAAPSPTLIVDANESWTPELLLAMRPVLQETRVALLEQPLPASCDEALRGLDCGVPMCADESCHVAADVARLRDRYQAVNIKLDKTGGLTAALELEAAATSAGLKVMVGCMICTSLSIAPAVSLARRAAFADLDGPTWLLEDRPGGLRVVDGELTPPSPTLWRGA